MLMLFVQNYIVTKKDLKVCQFNEISNNFHFDKRNSNILLCSWAVIGDGSRGAFPV